MKPRIMAIAIKKRNEEAVEVQSILTEFGCYIQTRLGLHDTYEGCASNGIIILQLRCDDEVANKLSTKLDAIDGVTVSLMELKM
ncbi:MAG: hypothetical protein PHY08_02925 [Candidatus Cloacimonetes bacterium]|jgi:hypothetical protein|nr:hypothetical protein [Candidatus Cloacimonadota bacterium]MDD4155505.1 hypothetical protein [Candidatus Cloacimonadota bacterium]